MNELKTMQQLAADAMDMAAKATEKWRLMLDMMRKHKPDGATDERAKDAVKALEDFSRVATNTHEELTRKREAFRARFYRLGILEVKVRFTATGEIRPIRADKPNDKIDHPYFKEAFYRRFIEKFANNREDGLTVFGDYDIPVIDKYDRMVAIVKAGGYAN